SSLMNTPISVTETRKGLDQTAKTQQQTQNPTQGPGTQTQTASTPSPPTSYQPDVNQGQPNNRRYRQGSHQHPQTHQSALSTLGRCYARPCDAYPANEYER